MSYHPLTSWNVTDLASDREWTFDLCMSPKYALAYANADLEGTETLLQFLKLDPYELAQLLKYLPYHTGQGWGFMYLGDCGMRVTARI